MISRDIEDPEDEFDGCIGANTAARRCDVHPETIKRYIREGVLPASKFHGKWMIKPEAVAHLQSAFIARPSRLAPLNLCLTPPQ